MAAPLPSDFYRTLFEKAPIGLALCRMDGKLVAVNDAYAAILGRTVAETLELSYWQITPIKYERQEAEQLESMDKEGRYGPYEKEYLHREPGPDGKPRLVPVRLNGVVVTIEGEPYIWSQVEDLTEEKYRKLFQAAHPPMALCAMDGTLLLVNQTFADLLGRTIDDTIGLCFWSLTPKQYEERDKRILQQLEAEGKYGPYETIYRDRTGKPFDVTLYGRGFTIHRQRYVLSYVDVAERAGQVEGAEPFEWVEQPEPNAPERVRPIKER